VAKIEKSTDKLINYLKRNKETRYVKHLRFQISLKKERKKENLSPLFLLFLFYEANYEAYEANNSSGLLMEENFSSLIFFIASLSKNLILSVSS